MTGAQSWVPDELSAKALRLAVQSCEGCDLFRRATQAVFGEGPAGAPLFLIGEQPGNEEDLQGHPFVGPAGHTLDRALEEARIGRSEVYLTNAVKHFKFEERGKRRIHKKPGAGEIGACRPWLEAEIRLIRPKVMVCLGATASQALMGRTFRLTQHRGQALTHEWAGHVVATIHPSAILRMPDADDRHAEFAHFVRDLAFAKSLTESGKKAGIIAS